jgi:hypothetical protein
MTAYLDKALFIFEAFSKLLVDDALDENDFKVMLICDLDQIIKESGKLSLTLSRLDHVDIRDIKAPESTFDAGE